MRVGLVLRRERGLDPPSFSFFPPLLSLLLALVGARPAVQVQAGPSLLRGHGRGEVGQTWSEGRRGGAGGEQVEEQERGGSVSNWPVAPLDITLPLELSSKPVKSPAETVSEVGGDDPEGNLFQSIRGLYEGRVEKIEHSDNSSDPDPVVKRSWSVGQVSSIAALGLGGGFSLLLATGAVASLLCSRRRRLRKADSMDRSFLSDSYSASYNGDSETFNSISYADCAGIEIPKDNSSEELYNLDNDSFLNSLEAISFPDTWPEAKL